MDGHRTEFKDARAVADTTLLDDIWFVEQFLWRLTICKYS